MAASFKQLPTVPTFESTFSVWVCLWTSATTTYVWFKVITASKFLLTDVTCQPSTFIVRPQQMWLKMVKSWKTVRTVSTRKQLCTSVSINMTPQFIATFKHLPTETTVVRSSCVDSHVFVQISKLTKCLVTRWTFVQFPSTVNSAMSKKMIWSCKSFAAHSILKQFLSDIMYIFVTFQVSFISKPFVTHCTHIWSWLLNRWMLSNIITISFDLHLKWTFTCIICTTSNHNSDSIRLSITGIIDGRGRP